MVWKFVFFVWLCGCLVKNLFYSPLGPGESFFVCQFDKYQRIYIKVSLQVLKKTPPLSQKIFQKGFPAKKIPAPTGTPLKKIKIYKIQVTIYLIIMIKQQTLKKNIAEYTDTKIKKTGKIHYIGQTTQPFIKERPRTQTQKKNNHLSDNKIQKSPTEYEIIPLVIFKLNSVTNEDLNPIETEFIKIRNTFP